MNQFETLDQNRGNRPLPNAGGILAMGIISIVLAGLIGLILGIIALTMSNSAKAMYEANPMEYSEASYKNMNAGRTCAIIGVSISGLAILVVLMMVGSR